MEQKKERRVQEIVADLESVVVAFSGGADSALLLKIALDTLGSDRVLAVTGRSGSVSEFEMSGAQAVAEQMGARHRLVETDEANDPNYAANPTNRCYFCKSELYSKLRGVAKAEGLKYLVAGVIADDAGDWRPGLKAAKEAGVRAPLAEAGITKADVRAISKQLGLSTWDKPAMACLASRFPYGESVTPEKLLQVEQAESLLRELGFVQYRVRHHGDLARIEVAPAEIERMLDNAVRKTITARYKELGYRYVTFDLQGYRTGSLNEVL